jgi:hypothetical protein
MIKPEKYLEYLAIIFSTIFISGINIILSGHLLGYVLNLNYESTNSFRLKIPWMLDIKIKGDRVFAGFAAFSISLLIVGIWFTDFANSVFINNLRATDSNWTACQALATSFSLSICLIVGGLKFSVLGIKAANSNRSIIL